MASREPEDPPGENTAQYAEDAAAPARPPRRIGVLAIVASIALTLDVVSKVAAVAALADREPVRLFGGALYLVLYRNSGAAFSLATGMTWLLTLVAVGVVLVIVRVARRLRSTGWALGLGLVLGGALGNLVDRFLRAPGPLRGHVIDFLSLFAPDGSVWPVFNLADSAIVCGAVVLVLLTFTGRYYDGTRDRRARRNPAVERDAAVDPDTKAEQG